MRCLPFFPSFLFLLLFLLLLVPATQGKRYTLKGEPLWPSDAEIASLRSSLKGDLLTDQDPAYHPGHTYNLRSGPPRPAIVIIPADRDDIARTLRFARDHVIRVSVASTGHHQDARNTADHAIRLNMTRINHREVDREAGTITVGPGQAFAEIHEFLRVETNATRVAASGAEPGVGPAGWALGGGHGMLTRLHGLGVDCLVKLEVVLANGSFAEISEQHHPDLFRAMRGGAASSFAVVYSLTFKIFPDPGPTTILWGIFPALDVVGNAFQSWLSGAPDNAGGYFITSTDLSTGDPFVLLHAHCFGVAEDCKETLDPLATSPLCLYCEYEGLHPSYSSYLKANQHRDSGGQGSLYMSSTVLDLSSPGQMAAVVKFQRDFKAEEWPLATVGCYANGILGGVSRDLDPEGALTSVAPALRRSLVALTCFVAWPAPVRPRQDLVDRLDRFQEEVLRKIGVEDFVYWNEPQHNFAGGDWQRRYWGSQENYGSLRAVKDRYDPDHVLTCYHCVGWEDVENVDPTLCPRGCSCSNMPEEGVCANDQ